jgi:hypothetical protein
VSRLAVIFYFDEAVVFGGRNRRVVYLTDHQVMRVHDSKLRDFALFLAWWTWNGASSIYSACWGDDPRAAKKEGHFRVTAQIPPRTVALRTKYDTSQTLLPTLQSSALAMRDENEQEKQA